MGIFELVILEPGILEENIDFLRKQGHRENTDPRAAIIGLKPVLRVDTTSAGPGQPPWQPWSNPII